MTQIDLPQLSLQRYVDLLRRRRWQVIPVSLFGLLVGGLVAFFIPRYYVADTLIEHQQAPGQRAVGRDPVKAIVDNARQTLQLAVGKAIQDLRWAEGRVADAYERTQFEREVRSRLQVYDLNPDPDRTYAQIRVTFKDLDGKRAAALLNAVVPAWKQKRLEDLREGLEQEQQQAKMANERYSGICDKAQLERRSLERLHRIDPLLSIPAQQQLAEKDRLALQQVREKVLEKERQRVGLKKALEEDQDQLEGMTARVTPSLAQIQAVVSKHPEGALLVMKYIRARDEVAAFRETRHEYARAKRALELAEKQLLEILGPGVLDPAGAIANPEYEIKVAKIKAQQSALALLDLEIEQAHKFVAENGKRHDELIGGFTTYENRQRDQTEAEEQREIARKRMQELDNMIGRLTNEQTIKIVEPAREPPRPTEPNILVVALIGCVLGLAFAVAMILLLDVLQGAFKSIEDVEDGLPVPVLGGISHLETEAERQRAIRTRRRTTVTAAAVVCLCVALVLLFYADPTRLPPVVRDLLALLLGA